MKDLLWLTLKCQCETLLVTAEALKMYDAAWLPNAKQVARGPGGRFASKGGGAQPQQQSPQQQQQQPQPQGQQPQQQQPMPQIPELDMNNASEVGKMADQLAKIAQQLADQFGIREASKDFADALKQGVEINSQMIKDLLLDDKFRKKAGLAPGMPMARAIDQLATQGTVDPALAPLLDGFVQKMIAELAGEQGETPFGNAVKEGSGAKLPKSGKLKDKLEFATARFKALDDAFAKSDKHNNPERLAGELVNAAVPVAAIVGLAGGKGLDLSSPNSNNQLIDKEQLTNPDSNLLKSVKDAIDSKVKDISEKVPSIESAKTVGKSIAEGAEITAQMVQTLAKDKAFRERAGLAAGMVGAELVKNLSKNPQISAKLDQIITENSANLAEQYGDDKDPFAQALRKAKLPELPKDASFAEKMEYNISRYKALEDALENPDKYSKKEELVAKTMKAAVPVAASLALAVAPEVAIGLLMGEGLTSILAGSAAGLATSFAANKAMDAAKIDNPAARLGIELAVGVATGAIVTGAAKKIASLKKAKEVAELAAKEAKEKVRVKKIPKLPDDVVEAVEEADNLKWSDYLFEVAGKDIEMSILEQPTILNKRIADIMFDVDKTMDFNESLDPKSRAKIALKLKRTFDYVISRSDEGVIFRCAAWAKDGKADYRSAAYQAMGFSEPQEGVMLGIVKNGKLEPFYPPFIKLLSKVVN